MTSRFFIEFDHNKDYRIYFNSRQEVVRALERIGTGAGWHITTDDYYTRYFRYIEGNWVQQ